MKKAYALIVSAMILCLTHAEDKHLVAIIPSYNNMRWYEQNLNSLVEQTYTNWHAIYIDDYSTDCTGDVVKTYIESHGLNDKITLIRNTENHGALYNIYHAIHFCNDNDIVLMLDGDDWLKDKDALAHINDLYQSSNVWLTYGMTQVYPNGGIIGWQAIPEITITTNSFRTSPWLATALRTCYAWLFKQIKKEDLLYEGQFFSCAWDLALMFPMLEMAGKHIRHCPYVVYVYNMSNPINDYNVRLEKQLFYDDVIRKRKRYEPLMFN